MQGARRRVPHSRHFAVQHRVAGEGEPELAEPWALVAVGGLAAEPGVGHPKPAAVLLVGRSGDEPDSVPALELDLSPHPNSCRSESQDSQRHNFITLFPMTLSPSPITSPFLQKVTNCNESWGLPFLHHSMVFALSSWSNFFPLNRWTDSGSAGFMFRQANTTISVIWCCLSVSSLSLGEKFW